MTHVRVWKFRPPGGRESAFSHAYGPDGVWATLFAKARGYRGTQLLAPTGEGGWWLTIDRWDDEDDFEAFQRELGEEYRALDAELEGVAGDEVFVGVFEED